VRAVISAVRAAGAVTRVWTMLVRLRVRLGVGRGSAHPKLAWHIWSKALYFSSWVGYNA
jgi:hypothetical protein